MPATTATPPIPMPLRNERIAPVFDSSKPRELSRFFEDLEVLMVRADITDHQEKKKQVLRYVDFDTEQIWKTFIEYSDNTKTYEQFKDSILIHYPDASGDFIYSLRDMDQLIGERQRIGITTTQDLSAYHLQFIAITTWLISKGQLGDLEQQRAYVRAFQPPFLSAIMTRLQYKDHDHHPNVPYKIKIVYEAARFILQGMSHISQNYSQSSQTSSTNSQPSPSDPYIKTESLGSILSEFTKSIVEALHNSNARNSPRAPHSHSHTHDGNHNPVECNYCGEDHYIRDCPHVLADTTAGLCRRNIEGKVILPTGAYVPRDIQGKRLRDRIKEWHRRNPNQLAAATLIHTIDKRFLNIPQNNTAIIPLPPQNTYQLSTTDRIATLEAELFNLRARKTAFVLTIRTRGQKARDTRVDDDDEEAVAAARARQQSRIEEVEEETTVRPQDKPQERATTVPTSSTQPIILPEHPFRNAKDAAYAPPTTKTVGAQDKAPTTVNKKPDPAYRTLPPIHDPTIATDVYNQSMEAPVTITQRELLSLSPEVRSKVRDSTTTRRIPTRDNLATQNLFQEEEDPPTNNVNELPIFPTFAIPMIQPRTPPPGAIVIEDPIEAYYRSLKPGEELDLDRLIVSKESGAVRSIFALIDSSHKTECILDPGCQIIAMSESTCHDLALVYDPSIKLHMQSANGNIDQSLGLARNVPFQIGPVTFYLQVHIIRSPLTTFSSVALLIFLQKASSETLQTKTKPLPSMIQTQVDARQFLHYLEVMTDEKYTSATRIFSSRRISWEP